VDWGEHTWLPFKGGKVGVVGSWNGSKWKNKKINKRDRFFLFFFVFKKRSKSEYCK
jgi:hypothetical protein